MNCLNNVDSVPKFVAWAKCCDRCASHQVLLNINSEMHSSKLQLKTLIESISSDSLFICAANGESESISMVRNRYSIWRKVFQAQSHGFYAQTSTNLLYRFFESTISICARQQLLSTRHFQWFFVSFFLLPAWKKYVHKFIPLEMMRNMCTLTIKMLNCKILKRYEFGMHHVIARHRNGSTGNENRTELKRPNAKRRCSCEVVLEQHVLAKSMQSN